MPAGASTFYIPLSTPDGQPQTAASVRRTHTVGAPGTTGAPPAAIGAHDQFSSWSGFGCLATPGFSHVSFSRGRLCVLDRTHFTFDWRGENEKTYHLVERPQS